MAIVTVVSVVTFKYTHILSQLNKTNVILAILKKANKLGYEHVFYDLMYTLLTC